MSRLRTLSGKEYARYSLIGNFRVASSLCFKARLNAKPLIQNCQFHVPVTQFVFTTLFCISFVFNSPRDDCQSQEKFTTILMKNLVGKANCTMENVSEGCNCPRANNSHFHNKDCTQPRFGTRKSSIKITFYLMITTKCFPCHEKRTFKLSKNRSKP